MDQHELQVRERVVAFGPQQHLVGILTMPHSVIETDVRSGVVLLNAGLIHKVGPSRVHVRLCRRLTALGCATLRFDLSGLGDSGVVAGSGSLTEQAVEDVRQAVSFLSSTCSGARLVLFGICLGADLALLALEADPRVFGAIAINGGTLTLGTADEPSTGLAERARLRFFRRRLLSVGGWHRLLSGSSESLSLRGLLRACTAAVCRGRRRASSDASGVPGWQTSGFRAAERLVVYSEWDPALDAFRMTAGRHFNRRPPSSRPEVQVLAGADHVITPVVCQESLVDIVCDWVGRKCLPIVHR